MQQMFFVLWWMCSSQVAAVEEPLQLVASDDMAPIAAAVQRELTWRLPDLQMVVTSPSEPAGSKRISIERGANGTLRVLLNHRDRQQGLTLLLSIPQGRASLLDTARHIAVLLESYLRPEVDIRRRARAAWHQSLGAAAGVHYFPLSQHFTLAVQVTWDVWWYPWLGVQLLVEGEPAPHRSKGLRTQEGAVALQSDFHLAGGGWLLKAALGPELQTFYGGFDKRDFLHIALALRVDTELQVNLVGGLVGLVRLGVAVSSQYPCYELLGDPVLRRGAVRVQGFVGLAWNF